MVATRQEFTRHLVSEFETLIPNSEQRLLEPIRADLSLFRLNLCPLKSRHGTTDRLIPFLLQTSKLVNGTKIDLLDTWAIFIQLCEESRLESFRMPEVRRFDRWLARKDYPTIHHSQAYRREYQPAYRLILAQFIPELGLTDAG